MMTLWPAAEWLAGYAALGAISGFSAGLLGVGGGAILMPLLTSLFISQGFEQPLPMALGTALTSMILTSAASSRAHHRRAAVAWPVVAGMALGIICGASIGAQLASRINATYIALFFSIFMLLLSIQLLSGWQPEPAPRPLQKKTLWLSGCVIGCVSALAAVGGGFLTVMYLNYKNFAIKTAIGTAAAIGLPIALAGAGGYIISGWSHTQNMPYAAGYVYLPAAFMIALAGMVAAPLGAQLSRRLSARWLTRLFAAISLLLSVRMVWQTWF